MAAHNDVGMLGELMVAQMLESVAPVVSGYNADLRFQGLEIEVKAARLRPFVKNYSGYQFSIYRRGHSQLRAPVLVLVCFQDESVPTEIPDPTSLVYFIIPGVKLSCVKRITIPRMDPMAYTGRWAIYRNRWETIAEVQEANSEYQAIYSWYGEERENCIRTDPQHGQLQQCPALGGV